MNQAIASYHDLANGITVVDAEYGSSGVAALYLLIENDQVAIIETGTNHSVPIIKQVLDDKGLSFDNVCYIMPTHVHLDHAGGAGELMRLCKSAELVIHPFGAKHMINPSRLEAGTIAVYGEENFRKLYGRIVPVDATRVIQTTDGFTLSIGGRELAFIHTEGHARHHYCVVDETSNGIFTGDTFGISYPQLTTDHGGFSFATTTPVQFDPDALLLSIDRLVSYNAKYAYLTHFGAIEATDNAILQLKQSVKSFKEIGLNASGIQEDRITHLQNKLMEYLLGELKLLNCKQSIEYQRDVISNDVMLNAQGIDVWLKRLSQ